MAALNSRGWEVLDPTPMELAVDFPDRPSMMDILRAQVLRSIAERDESDETNMDAMDFDDDDAVVGDDGLYGVPDYVPDKITEDMLRPETEENPASEHQAQATGKETGASSEKEVKSNS
nr:MAG TPA: hypothetical protein [Microviridae sp.]